MVRQSAIDAHHCEHESLGPCSTGVKKGFTAAKRAKADDAALSRIEPPALFKKRHNLPEEGIIEPLGY